MILERSTIRVEYNNGALARTITNIIDMGFDHGDYITVTQDFSERYDGSKPVISFILKSEVKIIEDIDNPEETE